MPCITLALLGVYSGEVLYSTVSAEMLVIGLVGLLVFGKEMPAMSRKAARVYSKYRKMVTDATSDIQREMDYAAREIEEEKRRIADHVKIQDPLQDRPPTPQNTIANTSVPPKIEASAQSSPAPKVVADPLALDVIAPSNSIVKNTQPAKPPISNAAALDQLQRDVPLPTKIPPPVG